MRGSLCYSVCPQRPQGSVAKARLCARPPSRLLIALFMAQSHCFMEQEKDSGGAEGRAGWRGQGGLVLITSGETQRHRVNHGPPLPSSPLCIFDQTGAFYGERDTLLPSHHGPGSPFSLQLVPNSAGSPLPALGAQNFLRLTHMGFVTSLKFWSMSVCPRKTAS